MGPQALPALRVPQAPKVRRVARSDRSLRRFSCWDLNANGQADLPAEDINGDTFVNTLDCAGPQGVTGAAGADGADGAPGATGAQGVTGAQGRRVTKVRRVPRVLAAGISTPMVRVIFRRKISMAILWLIHSIVPAHRA